MHNRDQIAFNLLSANLNGHQRGQVAKLYVNGRFLTGTFTGVQRYGCELLRELDLILQDLKGSIQVEILVPRGARDLPAYRAMAIRPVGILRGHMWEQLELPLYCRGEILFTPTSAAPLLHRRNVVTIHDAAIFSAPEGYSWRYRMWYRVLGLVLCRRALKVLTVSKFSKQELLRWCCSDESRIAVTYESGEHARRISPDRSILERFSLVSGSYILAVGSNNPNKNFRVLAQVLPYLQHLNYQVAIAGNHDDRVFRSTVAGMDGVKQLGYVTDAELRALYEGAVCFVFPSLYEGFGLPPLEALSLGCPVAVSNRTSMPEVLEGLAVFFDPDDPEDIARKIVEAAESRHAQVADDEAQLRQLAQFSWKTCAAETWSLLQECLSL